MKQFKFTCGCSFPIICENPLQIDFNPDIEQLPIDCVRTWDLISSGNTLGVFQLESRLGQSFAAKVKPTNIGHLSDLIAILRPGSMEAMLDDGISITNHYINRKNHGEEITYIIPQLKPILHKTYGLLIYQEQALSICRDIAGFTLQEVDAMRKCVTGDTMFVSKTRGWISIDNLLKNGYINDEFLIMDNKGSQKWKKIKNIWSTGKHDTHLITTNTGFQIQPTQYHQILTNNGWKAEKRLNNNDYIVCCNNINYDGKDIITLSEAMVIAGILTEGYFVDYNRCATFVAYEKDMMDIFILHFKNVFNIEPKLSKNGKVAYINKQQKQILNQILSYGLSKDKFIPDVMMGMTKESTRAFLSFMFGAEGSITKNNKQLSFSSKSHKMIYQIKLLLLRFGIRSNIISKKVKGYKDLYYELYICDNIDRQKFYDELSINLPKYKKINLKSILNKKSISNFTTNIVPNNIVLELINQYPMVGKKESGSLYKRPISRNRFIKIANKTNDKYWISYALGKHSYDSIDNKVLIRQKTTYDFSMEDDSEPYIVANGIVIHNSIGKKKPEEMAKLKTKFIDGCINSGKANKEQAGQIFEWIQASQRYSFNASHSYAYAINSYISAYAKAHFPKVFFTSYLDYAKEKLDPKEEIYNLINNARQMNIDVNGPDIRHLNNHFLLKDNEIWFGLGQIKGIGETSIKKLLEILKDQQIKSWSDFLFDISPRLSSVIVDALIKSGALHYFKLPRQKMLFEYQSLQNLTDRELSEIKKIRQDKSLLEVLNLIITMPTGKNQPLSSSKRKVVIESMIKSLISPPYLLEDSPEWIASVEESLLGIAITCSKVDGCDTTSANATCRDFLNSNSKNGIIIAVQIDNIREITTKKGDLMAFVKISDISGFIDAVVFPSEYSLYKHILLEGNTLLVSGERGKKEKNSFILNKAWQI